MSVNSVFLIGNLGRDAELRFTQKGNPVSNFSLATTERWNDATGNKQEKTTWHRCVLWGKTAETLNDYLVKGKQICIQGKLQNRDWNDKDGNKRYTTEVVVNNVTLLGGRGDNESRVKEARERDVDPSGDLTDDDIPF